MDSSIVHNTDCVYFLASPLTCKKGSECEFRHSEIARLNPRECWYWLNGNCLNPTCAFRHPPLEVYSGNPRELVQSRANETSKSDVPCYFYFNAYCIKGDQCPFMHDLAPVKKLANPAADLSIAHPLEEITCFYSDTIMDKNSAGSNSRPASVEVPSNHSDDASETIRQIDSRIVPPQSISDNQVEENLSAELSTPDYEEPAISHPPFIDYDNNGELVCTDESSEAIENECTEQDEWLESSPGFDVLVNNCSEQFAYEDDDGDADHFLGRERAPERPRSHLFEYDFEDSAGHDHLSHPESGYTYEQSFYNYYDHPADDRHSRDYFHGVSEVPRKKLLEPIFQRKRRPLHRNYGDGNRMDLRDHLRKRSKVDTSRRRHNSRSRNENMEQIQPFRPFPHGRLSAEFRKKSKSSQSDTDSGLNFPFRRCRLHNSQAGRFNNQPGRRERIDRRERVSQRKNGRPSPALYSEVHRISDGNNSSEGAKGAAFSGPKSLAQIREEKNRVKTDGNRPTRCPRNEVPNFEGPRPLSDILNQKKTSMFRAPNAGVAGTKIEQDRQRNSHGDDRANSGSGDYLGDFVDNDEEDGFHRKLADIFGK